MAKGTRVGGELDRALGWNARGRDSSQGEPALVCRLRSGTEPRAACSSRPYPRRVASHFAALGQIAILPLALPAGRSPVSAFWLRGRPPGPAARTMLECMREVEAERAPT